MKLAWVLVALVWVGCDRQPAASSSSGSATTGSGDVAEEDDHEAAPPPQAWKIGDVVQVRRDDKRWYEAEVVAAGPPYKVMYTFADAVEDNVVPARVRAVRFSRKTHVQALVGGQWKRGTVTDRHDGSYDIALDDGNSGTFTAEQVRGDRKPKTAAASTSTSTSTPAAAPCPAPAYIMRCGGQCVDTHQDFNNCGTCGHRCMPGGRCDSGSCRDKDGDL